MTVLAARTGAALCAVASLAVFAAPPAGAADSAAPPAPTVLSADAGAVRPVVGYPTLTRRGSRLTVEIPLACPVTAGGCAVSATLRPARGTGTRAVLGRGSAEVAPATFGVLVVPLGAGTLRLAEHGRLAIRSALTSTDATDRTVSFERSDVFRIPKVRGVSGSTLHAGAPRGDGGGSGGGSG